MEEDAGETVTTKTKKAAAGRLSKSQYMRGLQCPKSLWIYRHKRELVPAPGPELQHIFDQGHEVGEHAQKYFPKGKLIKADYLHIPEALEQTKLALADGAKLLYEPAFQHDNVLVRPDIMVYRSRLKAWDLIEVKSTTQVKAEHYDDVSVQRHVVEGAGLPVHKCFLMHLNNKYVRQGDLDIHALFTLSDVTEEAEDLQKRVPERLKNMREVIGSRFTPAVDIGQQCEKPYDCDLAEHCWSHVPDYSIYDLTRATWEKIAALRAMGVMKLRDIPPDFKLSPSQQRQVSIEQSGKPRIHPEDIKDSLEELEYPLYFLDFETVNPAIPPYDGTKPYQQIPFQASIHIRMKPGERPKHLEFLGDGKHDPRPALAEFLTKSIGPKGGIVAYNASFEKSCIYFLAQHCTKLTKPLMALTSRLWDLAVPFRKGHFQHPGFQGSYSIKAVLPTLVPTMSYKGLDIGEGGAASRAYLRLMRGKMSPEEARKLRKALKVYCGQDTLGMVELLDALEKSKAD